MATDNQIIGTLFDNRYQIQAQVGSGGMADVFVAQDETLGRQVAIKLLHQRYAQDQAFVERFMREASAAAKLNHPNIVQVYDRGEASGTYYIAMEYVQGTTLKDIIRQRGPLADGEIFNYSRQGLHALRFAHRNGVVHRDIKPHNLMIDGEGKLKVADFGIARAGAESGLTEAGSIVGTAQYLSPEQAQGMPVTAASDLYSLGVVMFEMATGRVPFEGGQPVNVALRHVNEQAPLPEEIYPSVNRAISLVIRRSMDKDPAMRYATADDMLFALDGAEQGAMPDEPTTVVPIAATPPMAAPAPFADTDPAMPVVQPRKKWPWVLLALLILGVIGAGAWAYSNAEGELVAVPDVTGKTTSQAQNILEEAELELGKITEVTSDERPGTIVAQTPEADAEVETGERIDVDIVKGTEQVEVPDVVGMNIAQATRDLEGEGFSVTTTDAASDEPEDTVLSQNPASGTEATEGSTVALVVSSGSGTTAVPSLIGLTETEAKSKLREDGFSSSSTSQDGADEKGIVLSQSPAAGTELKNGETVQITVSSGRNTVPDVVGRSQETAVTELEGAGFIVITNEEDPLDPTVADGTVLKQQPPASAGRAVGTTITITVAVTPEALPDP